MLANLPAKTNSQSPIFRGFLLLNSNYFYLKNLTSLRTSSF